ncbi:MAG: hypothetical protein J3Q66DRAFT_180180 [Benniella sp.]|nr:MAG: hypothetical protein J3Q66DRAFT_180180 [Benniella sp.]
MHILSLSLAVSMALVAVTLAAPIPAPAQDDFAMSICMQSCLQYEEECLLNAETMKPCVDDYDVCYDLCEATLTPAAPETPSPDAQKEVHTEIQPDVPSFDDLDDEVVKVVEDEQEQPELKPDGPVNKEILNPNVDIPPPEQTPEPEQVPEPEQPELDQKAPEPEQPDLDQPDLDQPDLDQPDLDQPDLDQEEPELEQPELEQPDPVNKAPELEQPDLEQPDLEQPDLDQEAPELEQPELEQPDVVPEPEQEPEQPVVKQVEDFDHEIDGGDELMNGDGQDTQLTEEEGGGRRRRRRRRPRLH